MSHYNSISPGSQNLYLTGVAGISQQETHSPVWELFLAGSILGTDYNGVIEDRTGVDGRGRGLRTLRGTGSRDRPPDRRGEGGVEGATLMG